jgi:hypothetical protein
MLNYGYVPFPGHWEYLPILQNKIINTDINEFLYKELLEGYLKV